MTKITGALFDLDGVLVDTEGIYTDFWNDIDSRYPTGVPDFARVIKGNTLSAILSTYFPDADIQQQIRSILKEQEATMVYRFFDGVPDLLRRLHSAGFGIAIVTSSNRAKTRNLFAALPELADVIDALVTDEDVTRSKPDPQGYLLGAERIGRRPEECYVFEDSLAGLRAGRAAGATVIGIATTNTREVVEPLADITIDNTADFVRVISLP